MNRLAQETSPYLLQHANNPVDWYPWGTEALERARGEDRVILLSIGYAACHWCHVMERESFEDPETAQLMNELFVNIKVDREERPDLDAVYMSATQAMTGHGGWPMTVFLKPDGVPFYAGTYFPLDDRHGIPAFKRVMKLVADAYRDRRSEVERTAAALREMYQRSSVASPPAGALAPATLDRAYRTIVQRFDTRFGGLEGAPKFPQSMALDFVLRYWRRTGTEFGLEMAAASVRAMARGGIYDQVGGGFHRYSVDAIWLVPHFEKMLYDNALLARLALHLYQATGDEEFRRVTEETIGWVAREMTAPAGGFFSTLDADSEGEEGKFYVWSASELDALLGDDATVVKSYYGVTPAGNFEGHNILSVPADIRVVAARTGIEAELVRAAVTRARDRLYAARAGRVWPARDEKVLAGWNGLMLRVVAESARVLGSDTHRALAVANGEFLFREMVRDGRVMRTHKDGITRLNGYLEDYAAVGLGALALYELTFEQRWLDRARLLAESIVTWFWEEENGVLYDTSLDHERLVTRPREVTDNAVPSGTSLGSELLLRIATLTDDTAQRSRALRILDTLADAMSRHGTAFGHLLGVADMALHGATEVALVGVEVHGAAEGAPLGAPATRDDAGTAKLEREVAHHYVPALVLAGTGVSGDGTENTSRIALLRGRTPVDGRATAYVCRGYTCEAPVTDAAQLGAQLEEAVRATAGGGGAGGTTPARSSEGSRTRNGGLLIEDAPTDPNGRE